jgi:hypothetical protein
MTFPLHIYLTKFIQRKLENDLRRVDSVGYLGANEPSQVLGVPAS